MYDILKLPTKGKFYPNKVSKLDIDRLTGKHEDILSSFELISTGEVWPMLYNLTVRNKELKWDELMFPDQFAFMIHTRKTAYGSVYEEEVDLGKGETDIAEMDLELVTFGEPSDVLPDEDGLYDFVFPQSKRHIKFRVLNNKEEEDVKKGAKQEQIKMNLPYPIEKTRFLEAIIRKMDGKYDPMAIRKFLEDEISPKDSQELRKYYNSLMPDVKLKIEATLKRTQKKVIKAVNVGPTFFFPSLGV